MLTCVLIKDEDLKFDDVVYTGFMDNKVVVVDVWKLNQLIKTDEEKDNTQG